MTTNNKSHSYTPENEIISLIKQLKNDTINAKEHFIVNKTIYGSKFCDSQLEKIQVLESKLQKSVRFDYLEIQKDIDELFKKDPLINGVTIHLYWNLIKNDKLGNLKYLINGNN